MGPLLTIDWREKETAAPEDIHSYEWLVTNGLGGYASGTVSGAMTRRYHGLLIAAMPVPLGRLVMLNSLAEEIRLPDGTSHPLLHLKGGEDGAGHACLTEFRLEAGLPVCLPAFLRHGKKPGLCLRRRPLEPRFFPGRSGAGPPGHPGGLHRKMGNDPGAAVGGGQAIGAGPARAAAGRGAGVRGNGAGAGDADVRERLLTPVGLRSLAPGHPEYKDRYFGDLRARDATYHQGTVWGWLIGPFIDAWLKLYPERLAEARSFLDGFGPHLGEAGVGSISEVFDAEPPFTARGCIAQAWSVAEVLRCRAKLETHGRT